MVQNKGLKNKISEKMDGINDPGKGVRRMHKTEVEDADFPGLSPAEIPMDQLTDQFLDSMSLDEKIQYISGYQDLAIQPLPRLGLPSIWCSDATAGLRSFSGGTSYPAPLGMTASWDEELIHQTGKALAREFRNRGISILLGPGINIYRVPTCGRNFEYMGEDPYLAGKMASSYIRGAREEGVITAVKHFACNNSEYDRHKTNSVVNTRALREIYLPAFEMAVKEGGARAVMTAYNPVNGSYASENSVLLKDILRSEWGFDGFVLSDWNSLYSTAGPIKSGLDLEMPQAKWFSAKKIRKALKRGNIREEDLNRMVKNLLGTLLKEGIYHRSQKDSEKPIHSEEQVNLARKVATESMILLKNSGDFLPLDPESEGTLIVTGRMSRNTETGGGGSSFVRTSAGIDFLTGITEAAGKLKVEYLPWSESAVSEEDIKKIRQARAVVYCAGFSHSEESECWDRSWDLPYGQSDSISGHSQYQSQYPCGDDRRWWCKHHRMDRPGTGVLFTASIWEKQRGQLWQISFSVR